jgi:hypothetical protein
MPAIPARERENWGLKPALANSSGDPILKKPITKKKAGGVVQGESPQYKP